MRARPARIMAELRSEYGLTVRDAWAVYRGVRDTLPGKLSLAALDRYSGKVRRVVRDMLEPMPEDFDYDYEWEITVEYEG